MCFSTNYLRREIINQSRNCNIKHNIFDLLFAKKINRINNIEHEYKFKIYQSWSIRHEFMEKNQRQALWLDPKSVHHTIRASVHAVMQGAWAHACYFGEKKSGLRAFHAWCGNDYMHSNGCSLITTTTPFIYLLLISRIAIDHITGSMHAAMRIRTALCYGAWKNGSSALLHLLCWSSRHHWSASKPGA